MAPIKAYPPSSTPECLGQGRLACAQPAASAWRRLDRWQVWPQTMLRTMLPASGLFSFLPARHLADGSSLAPSSMFDMPQAEPDHYSSTVPRVSRAAHRAVGD